MNIRHSETYRRPMGARYLVGSTLAPRCKSRYRVHFVAADVKSTRTILGQVFFSNKMRKTSENVKKILRVTMRIRIDTGKEIHWIRQWELQ